MPHSTGVTCNRPSAGKRLEAEQAVDQRVGQRRLDAEADPGRKPGPGHLGDRAGAPQPGASPVDLEAVGDDLLAKEVGDPREQATRAERRLHLAEPLLQLNLATGQAGEHAKRPGVDRRSAER